MLFRPAFFFLHVAVQCRFTSLLLFVRFFFAFFRVFGGLAHHKVKQPRTLSLEQAPCRRQWAQTPHTRTLVLRRYQQVPEARIRSPGWALQRQRRGWGALGLASPSGDGRCGRRFHDFRLHDALGDALGLRGARPWPCSHYAHQRVLPKFHHLAGAPVSARLSAHVEPWFQAATSVQMENLRSYGCVVSGVWCVVLCVVCGVVCCGKW